MINKNYTYAVIGASNNPEKYGHKVLADLLEAGYKVIPVNPHGGDILGRKIYNNLLDIPTAVDVAIFVVPPQITEKVLFDVKVRNINKVWLQPGSESEKAIQFCQENKIECVSNTCIMVERHKN